MSESHSRKHWTSARKSRCSHAQLFSSVFSKQVNATNLTDRFSVVVVHKFVRCWLCVAQPPHHICAVCFWRCVFLDLQAGVSFCAWLTGHSQVCVEDVRVWFDGGACAGTVVVAMTACHGDSEGVRVLQFHLVLLWHFDEGAPSECMAETSAKPTERQEESVSRSDLEHGKFLCVEICFTFGLGNSKL